MTSCVFCLQSEPIVWQDGHRDHVRHVTLPNGREVLAHNGCSQDMAMDMAMDMAEDHELRQAEDEERVASEEARGA